MIPLQIRYQYLQHFRKAIQLGQYPIGTIAYYGPDNLEVTKIIAAVLVDEKTNPIIKEWRGQDLAQNQEVAKAIGEYFQEMKVQKVVMTEGIIGCPHLEGVDFPEGTSCPLCPYWSNG